MSKKSYRIGIDVGGTFTKAALIDNIDGSVAGRSSVHTTHDHPDGVPAGVILVFERVLSDAGIDAIERAPARILQTCNKFLLSNGLDRKAVEDAVRALRSECAQLLVASAA